MHCIKREFKLEYWDEVDLWGWKPVNSIYADPSNYEIALPHDVLEHESDEDMTIADELMAMGTMLYTRVFPGWYEMQSRGRSLTPAEQISSEFNEFYRLHTALDYPIKTFDKSIERVGDFAEAENVVNEILYEGENTVRPEFMDEDLESVDQFFCEENLDNFANWMLYGYTRAFNKYGEGNESEIMYVFENLRKLAMTINKTYCIEEYKDSKLKVLVKPSYEVECDIYYGEEVEPFTSF